MKDDPASQEEWMAAKYMVEKQLADYEVERNVYTEQADAKLDKTEGEKSFNCEASEQYRPCTGYCP